ncbi:von Willebrand factor type A domain-containing protein [Favolaschia claudopus]|uniref:von Willebrand factor type A domain-containing protein n=1 Tax=Favolaschia claudopus TaxID=2862362 RepID=A0AAW0DQX4_9AGAR
MLQPWGLYHSFENRLVAFSLLQVHATVNIKDLAAEVKLTHTYCNDTEMPLEAVHSFPVPARAAVTAFVLVKEDGRKVLGRVHENAEAKALYQTAVNQAKAAAFLQQRTPDVFEVAVGNVLPHERVQIELVYVTELAEDEENDSFRFHLPVHIGSRYGQAPSSFDYRPWNFTPPALPRTPFLQILVIVEAVTPITKIGSPSHTVSVELGPDPSLPYAQDLPFANYARVSLSSESALDKDFVLTVKSAGIDSPRCVAELHPVNHTTALAFTVVPRFQLPDPPRQEFIFLVDRSGSMRGARIEAAKRALVVMLRSLPAKGSNLQVLSFGSECTALWDEGSQPYTQATLDLATQHVDGMDADYGGTEIRQALARCCEARRTDRPTSVFVLTDGAAWDLDGVFNVIKGAVASAPVQAYLRVFVLGMGDSGTAMCTGIARVGNGACMTVGEKETSFTGKIARLLKASRTPMFTSIVVDWGVCEETPFDVEDDSEDGFVFVLEDEETLEPTATKQVISLFDETVDPLQVDLYLPIVPKVVLPPFAPIQQSPFNIRSLSPGNRLNVYAIFQGKNVPKTVTLTALTVDGAKIQLVVPVTFSNLPNVPNTEPAIHALAARKLIQDLEDGQHAISIADDADLLARTVKASIVRLATTYSISSSHTSWVAVDESSGVPCCSNKEQPTLSTPTATPTSGDTQYVRRRCFTCKKTDSPSWRRSSLHPGKIVCNRCGLWERTLSHPRPATFKQANDEQPETKRARMRMSSISHSEYPLEALARLQSFDGSFSSDVLFSVKFHTSVEDARAQLYARAAPFYVPEVFATVIGMVYMCTKLGPTIERESWEAMYDKARAFVEGILLDLGSCATVAELETEARAVLARSPNFRILDTRVGGPPIVSRGTFLHGQGSETYNILHSPNSNSEQQDGRFGIVFIPR